MICIKRVWILIMATAAAALATVPTLPAITVVGSPFEVGQALGAAFSAQFAAFVATYPEYNQTLVPYANTPTGKAQIAQFLATTQALCGCLVAGVFGA